jgi:cell division protein FtsL
MEEPIMPQQSNQSSKVMLLVIITIIIAASVTGISMYLWQNSKINVYQQKHQQENTQLQNQVSQLQSEKEILENQKSETNNISSSTYRLVNNDCSVDTCLFDIASNNYPIGTTAITGYYTSVERNAWEKDETQTCDSFTITQGPEELIRRIVNLVDNGNTINSKNELNQPIINLGFELLSPTEKQEILNSTNNNQIELLVLTESPVEYGVSTCHHDTTVLRKK